MDSQPMNCSPKLLPSTIIQKKFVKLKNCKSVNNTIHSISPAVDDICNKNEIQVNKYICVKTNELGTCYNLRWQIEFSRDFVRYIKYNKIWAKLTWNDSVNSHNKAENIYVMKRLQWIVLRKQRSSLWYTFSSIIWKETKKKRKVEMK